MDKNSMFKPTKEETKNIADNYWSNLSDYAEKKLDEISNIITAVAKTGKYDTAFEVLKSEKDFIKEKLEDVGYRIKFQDKPGDEKNIFMLVYFN